MCRPATAAANSGAVIATVIAALLAALPLSAVARNTAVAPAAALQPACNWDAPGHDPFMGDVVAAINAYRDIPAATRVRLQQRMARRAYDEVVRIRRDGIEGRGIYRGEIRDMHFGSGRRCATVDRSAWSATAEERGLVYCEAGHCILVPTVCRNVSRIQRADAGRVAAADAGAAPSVAPGVDASPGAGPAQAVLPAAVAAAPRLAETAALPLSQVVSATGDGADGADGAGWPGRSAGPDAAAPSAPSFGGLSRWPDGSWTPAPPDPGSGAAPAPATPVPEPAALLLWLAGLALLALLRRRCS